MVRERESEIQVREWAMILLISKSKLSHYTLIRKDEEVLYIWWLG